MKYVSIRLILSTALITLLCACAARSGSRSPAEAADSKNPPQNPRQDAPAPAVKDLHPADRYIQLFFSDGFPLDLRELTLPDPQVTPPVWKGTIKGYRNIYLQGFPAKPFAQVDLTKTVALDAQHILCYLVVELRTTRRANPKAIFALRVPCVQTEDGWRVVVSPRAPETIPEIFTLIYKIRLDDYDNLMDAHADALRHIERDSAEQVELSRRVVDGLTAARTLLGQGQAQKALEAAEAVTAVDPANPDAATLAKQCLEAGATPLAPAPATAPAAPAAPTVALTLAPAAPAPAAAAQPQSAQFITRDDFNHRMDELTGQIRNELAASGQKGPGANQWVDRAELDQKLDTLIRETRAAQAKPQENSAVPAADTRLTQIFDNGNRMLDEREYRKAIVEFQKVLRIDPGNRAAQRLIQLCQKALETES